MSARAAVLVTLLAIPVAALAESEPPSRLPARWVQRPLTRPAATFGAEAALSIVQLPPVQVAGLPESPDPIVALGLGAAAGIVDDLEVALGLPPLALSPEIELGDPALSSTVRLVRGAVEIGARVGIALPVAAESTLRATLGAPLLVHAGTVRLDTGLFGTLVTGDDGHGIVSVPIAASLEVVAPVALRLRTGLLVGDVADVSESLAIPLAVDGILSFPGRQGALLDLSAGFGFPSFARPGSARDPVMIDRWEAGLAATVHLYLAARPERPRGTASQTAPSLRSP